MPRLTIMVERVSEAMLLDESGSRGGALVSPFARLVLSECRITGRSPKTVHQNSTRVVVGPEVMTSVQLVPLSANRRH
jgi:hypothetical protein